MKTGPRFVASIAAALAVAFAGGCSTPLTGPSVTYTYEPRFTFADAKTYRWTGAIPAYAGDMLLESNVRFLADRALASKGLSASADKADLLVSMRYELGSGYDLRALVLNIARADTGEVVWRGMAAGSIRTDAASGELKTSVEAMLANFPPRN